jgi:hypothetical protein
MLDGGYRIWVPLQRLTSESLSFELIRYLKLLGWDGGR